MLWHPLKGALILLLPRHSIPHAQPGKTQLTVAPVSPLSAWSPLSGSALDTKEGLREESTLREGPFCCGTLARG